MASVTGDRRVLIAVRPALLGEVLSRAVARKGLSIVACGADGLADDTGAFDVALVSSQLPPGASAEHVIQVCRFPDSLSRSGSRLVSDHAVCARSLAEVIVMVDLLCEHAPRSNMDRRHGGEREEHHE